MFKNMQDFNQTVPIEQDFQQEIPLVIGYVGTVLLILSMLAQIRAYFVSKDVSTMSYGVVFFQLAVNIMYLIYNTSILSLPIMIGNASMILCLS